MAPGRRSKCFSMSELIVLSGTLFVPNVSAEIEIGLDDSDRVRDLYLSAVRKTGRNDILSNVPSRVCRRSVHLRRVFARETRRRRAAPFPRTYPQVSSDP